MSFEAYTYFQIILAGFVTVWVYRNISKSKAKISDFEYLGWSAFWGLVLLVFIEFVEKDKPDLIKLLANPFATGIVLSIFGIIFGGLVGKILPVLLKFNIEIIEKNKEKFKIKVGLKKGESGKINLK